MVPDTLYQLERNSATTECVDRLGSVGTDLSVSMGLMNLRAFEIFQCLSNHSEKNCPIQHALLFRNVLRMHES